MPNWKKLITSGSDASLSSITTSGDITIPVTNKVYLDGGGDSYISTTTESSNNNISFVIGGNTRVKMLPHIMYINSTGANGLVINNDEGTTTNSGRIFFEGNSTSVIFQEADDLSFRTGGTSGTSSGTERFRVNTSGVAVTGAIDVSGDGKIQNDLWISTDLGELQFGAGKDGRIYSYNDDLYIDNQTLNQDIHLRVNDGGVYTTALFIDGDTSRVGVGTNSPASKLHIYEGTGTTASSTGTSLFTLTNYVGADLNQQKTFIDFTLLDDNANETPQVRIGAEVGQNGDANSQEKEGSGAFVVYTNNADTTSGDAGASLEERMRVDYQGNVGIGVASPSYKLDVSGDYRFKDTASGGALLGYHHNDSNNGLLLLVYGSAYSGGSVLSVGANGTAYNHSHTVGINAGAGSDIKFGAGGAEKIRIESDGDLHGIADIIAYSSTPSDKRLKDNVVTIGNSLDLVSQLRGVRFDWNIGSKKGKHDIGVIAQEVEQVIPEIVSEKKLPLLTGNDETIYKVVDYEKLTAVLIESIKELKQEIDDIKQKCDCLNK